MMAKVFQTFAVWLSSLIPTDSGGWVVGRRSSAEEEEGGGREKQPQRSVASRPSSSEGLQVHAEMVGRRGGEGGFKFRSGTRWVQELRTHSEEEEEEVATALGVFVQRSRSFHQKESPTSC